MARLAAFWSFENSGIVAVRVRKLNNNNKGIVKARVQVQKSVHTHVYGRVICFFLTDGWAHDCPAKRRRPVPTACGYSEGVCLNDVSRRRALRRPAPEMRRDPPQQSPSAPAGMFVESKKSKKMYNAVRHLSSRMLPRNTGSHN